MSELSFTLEKFQGPMDLLLHLISKHKLNISDISIVELLEQYLEYMNHMAERDMEIAGEFLEMAARLIYIKTVSLLPSHEEADEMKKELEGRLIEYSLCKKAALLLRERYQGNDIFVRSPAKFEMDNTYRLLHDPFLLTEVYAGLDTKQVDREKVSEAVFSGIVSRKIVSVTAKIIYILKKLYTTGNVLFQELFLQINNRSERVATFLAVLELTKSGRIFLSEDNREIIFNRTRKSESEETEENPERVRI